MRDGFLPNERIQEGGHHARLAEPVAHETVLQVPCNIYTELSPQGDLRVLRRGMGQVLRALCRRAGVETVESHAMGDHIHVCLGMPPKYSVAHAVDFLKGKSAIRTHRHYLGGQRYFSGDHFWARGYCISTVGLSYQTIRAYIRNQEMEDQRQEALRLQ